MTNQDLLRQRVQKFLNELNLPVSKFVKNIDIARTTYYRWIAKDFDFSEVRATQIDSYLSKYGF